LLVSASDVYGRPRYSAAVQIQVRESNDDFARAVVLEGTNLTASGNTYFTTTEPGEPLRPDSGGSTVWYRWTAPTNGVASLVVPGGDLVAVYRGDSLTNLQLVADNPEQSYGFWGSTFPVYPFLRFATRAGENYAIQVSLQVNPPLGVPIYLCEPPRIPGSPFTFTLNFLPHSIGLLDVSLLMANPPFAVDSYVFFFAAPMKRVYRLETSVDLLTWEPAAAGVASGGMEVVTVSANFAEPARFFRVRLDE
jgi:hypothetical protein